MEAVGTTTSIEQNFLLKYCIFVQKMKVAVFSGSQKEFDSQIFTPLLNRPHTKIFVLEMKVAVLYLTYHTVHHVQ